MEENKKDFADKKPQRLCKMCGKCCRVVTTQLSYEKLLELSKENDKEAMDFLEIFEPYPSVEEARKTDAGIVDNIIKELKETGNYDENNLTFYGCKHLLDNNLCAIYQDRKELCKRFPSSPWAVVPPGCGFEGWLFQEREAIMKKIRKLKEEIVSLEADLVDIKDEEQRTRALNLIEKMNRTVDLYAKYGSKDW